MNTMQSIKSRRDELFCMGGVMDNPSGIEDYVIECSEQELKALREAVKDADGRKSEVELARELLNVK